MRALLTNGEIVELAKDCNCITHEGPHWLHMSQIDKELNHKVLPRLQETESRIQRGEADYQEAQWYGIALNQLAKAEARRLGELARHYERLGITRIFREDSAESAREPEGAES